jgi:chloride channel 7
VINHKTVHGAISPEAGSLQPMEMKDWGMQLPFFLIDFGMAGLLGAAFNSLRMQLWKVRAAKTLHVQVRSGSFRR